MYDREARRSQRSGDVCVHSSSEPKAIRLHDVVATTWAETAVDLMRVLPPAFALAVGDAALRAEGLTTRTDLRELAGAQSARRGTAQLEWLWPRIDGRSESAGESDGYGKYLLVPGDDPLHALKREKTREDRLRSHMNGFRRWDYADALQAAPLRRKLSGAGLPHIHPEMPGMLATLARHPRSR